MACDAYHAHYHGVSYMNVQLSVKTACALLWDVGTVEHRHHDVLLNREVIDKVLPKKYIEVKLIPWLCWSYSQSFAAWSQVGNRLEEE